MKEQIEEMRKNLIEVFDEEYEKRRIITPQNTAEKMTDKGYRKQNEGEWVEHSNWAGSIEYKCTACKETTFHAQYYAFCPNCGAKMKGERDEG